MDHTPQELSEDITRVAAPGYNVLNHNGEIVIHDKNQYGMSLCRLDHTKPHTKENTVVDTGL